MKNRVFLFATLTIILILSACSPFVITSPSGQQPTPVIETAPATGYQPVHVDQVKAEVGVGSPGAVLVIVTGSLPDTCAQIELVQQKQVGSKFDITMSTVPSNADGCVQDTVPFQIMIPLNITNLPAGPYSVEVNGSHADFEVQTANTTSSQPTADSVIRKNDIQVADLNMEIGVGSPIPVYAIVGMDLANTCAQVGEIRLRPFLMELAGFTLPPNNINRNAISISVWPTDYEQQHKAIEAYNNEALQRFEQMSDSDVFPNVALLDQLVQSIQVNQP